MINIVVKIYARVTKLNFKAIIEPTGIKKLQGQNLDHSIYLIEGLVKLPIWNRRDIQTFVFRQINSSLVKGWSKYFLLITKSCVKNNFNTCLVFCKLIN